MCTDTFLTMYDKSRIEIVLRNEKKFYALRVKINRQNNFDHRHKNRFNESRGSRSHFFMCPRPQRMHDKDTFPVTSPSLNIMTRDETLAR